MTDSFRFGTLSFRRSGRATSAQAGSVSKAGGAWPTGEEVGCKGEGTEVAPPPGTRCSKEHGWPMPNLYDGLMGS